jgi:hypothetical protein
MAIGDLKAIKMDVDFASGMMKKAEKEDEKKKKEKEKKKKKKAKKKDEDDNENPWTKAFNNAMENQSAGAKAGGAKNEFSTSNWNSSPKGAGSTYKRGNQ